MYKKTIVRREKIKEFYGDRFPLTNEYCKLSDIHGTVPVTEIPEMMAVNRQDSKLARDTNLQIVCFTERINGGWGAGYYTVLPKTAIEEIDCKTILELATPILDAMMPGHWCYLEGNLCLHYPQINITNSLGDQYTVYDIVVGVPIRDTGMYTTLYGWKYSYTEEELNGSLNFIHPHLEYGAARKILSFCLGGSSPLKKWLDNNCNSIDEEKFTLFLYQLKDFLEWESLEGKPYYSIGNFNTLQATGESFSGREVKNFAKVLIKYITPDMIINGIFNPGLLGDKVITLQQTLIDSGELTDNMVGNYHEATQRFIRLNQRASSSNVTIPGSISNLIVNVQQKLNIQERVLPNPERQMPTTTKRIYNNLFTEAVKHINHSLKTSSVI